MVEPIARTIMQDQSRPPTQARAAKPGRRRTDLDAPDTLFVGSAGECRAAVKSPAFANGSAFRPIGFVDVELPPAHGALGDIGDIHLLLGASGARKVVVCGDLTDLQFQSVVDAAVAGGCEVLWVPEPLEVPGPYPTTARRQQHPLVQVVERVSPERACAPRSTQTEPTCRRCCRRIGRASFAASPRIRR